MNDYILSCEIPRGAEFFEMAADEARSIPRHRRYDIVRDESGSDIGIVLYNGHAPKGYRSHNRNVSWVFWEVGGLSHKVKRAFFKIPNGEPVLTRSEGNDLKMRAS